MLAVDAPGDPDPPLSNESFHLGAALPTPLDGGRLDAALQLRPRQLLFRSAVVVPWTDEHGDGVVIVGQTGVTTPQLPAPAADVVRGLGSSVRRTVAAGRRLGAVAINRDLQRSMKEVAAAAVDCADVGDTLTTLLVSTVEPTLQTSPTRTVIGAMKLSTTPAATTDR